MDFFCCFCSKTEEEVPLIEITSNSLFIDKTYHEFPNLFHDLFGLVSFVYVLNLILILTKLALQTPEDLVTNFLCETCKDSTVQFFVFKQSILSQENQHRKMILNQVHDFVSRNKSKIEDIQVVRKLDSLILQIDPNSRAECGSPIPEDCETKFNEILVEIDDAEEVEDQMELLSPKADVDMIFVTCYLPCMKCGEVLTSNARLEIHEFFKHSVLGNHIDNIVESCRKFQDDDETRKCSICWEEVSDSYEHHILDAHTMKILSEINDLLPIDTSLLDYEAIGGYINSVKELMANDESELQIDENIRKAFFDIYSVEVIAPIDEIEEVIQEIDMGDSCEESVEVKTTEKQKKSSLTCDPSRLAWVRKEIVMRKETFVSDAGVSRVFYRCAYCNMYSSNSAPGFRYHLISKHMGKNHQELVKTSEFVQHETRARKNTCNDCNLKLKDQRTFNAHMNCHELFGIISQYYQFPSCSTCNALYIDESTLAMHFVKHDTNRDVTQPVPVSAGAIIMQGKLIKAADSKQPDEVADDEFAWKCGHCSKKYQKEASCKFHILMIHAKTFNCPIDRREFSGFKAISLFYHHLKNKHSEMFPALTFSCTYCKMEFQSIYEKLSHMKKCSNRKFSCDHCGKKFFKKGDLIPHLKFVIGEISYPCDHCDKKCETASDLKIHIRSHTKEKPFSCAICDKSFRTLAARSAHLEIHSGNAVHEVGRFAFISF